MLLTLLVKASDFYVTSPNVTIPTFLISMSGEVRSGQVRSGQVRSGNLISPGEPLARGYFVAPSKEKKYTKYS